MADDPDALWKPGSGRDTAFDRLEPRPFVFPDRTRPAQDRPAPSTPATPPDRADVGTAGGQGEEAEPAGPGGRIAALAVVVAVVVGAALVVVLDGAPSGEVAAPSSVPVPFPTPVPSTFPLRDSGGDVPIDDADRSVLVSPLVCSSTRLPGSAEERWSIAIDGAQNLPGPLVAGAAGVAALTTDTAGPDATFSLRMFDALDGSQRWRTPIADPGSARRLEAVVAGVVIVEVTAVDDPTAISITGFDTSTGDRVWTRGIPTGGRYLVDRVSESIVVEDPDGGDPGVGGVLVVDASGGFVTGNVGRFVALDADRRLVTRVGDKFLATTGDGSDNNLIGVTFDDDPPSTVLGAAVLVADGDPGALRLLEVGPDGERIEGSLRLVGSPTIDPPSGITSLTGIDDRNVIVTGNGAVHGGVLDESGLRLRWRVDGALSATVPSDRGATLLVFSEGGALQRLVDASTGRKFLDIRSVGGPLGPDDLFVNGVVSGERSADTAVQAAYDLDGELMWRLRRGGPLAVGDRVVYATGRSVGTATEPPSVSVSIQAYGPVPDGPSTCDTGGAGAGEIES